MFVGEIDKENAELDGLVMSGQDVFVDALVEILFLFLTCLLAFIASHPREILEFFSQSLSSINPMFVVLTLFLSLLTIGLMFTMKDVTNFNEI